MSCRACGHESLEPILALGSTPLANSLLSPETANDAEPRYPLDLVLCPSCSLVQITETVPPQQLFGEYLYFSSFSETMLEHARKLVAEVVERRALGPQSLALEVASNDGYLLQYYKQAEVPVLGIEPAQNIARVAEERGIRTLADFFGRDVGLRLAQAGLRADVLHANNVLAHVADLSGFVEGLRAVLKDDGVAIIEAPYVRDMIEHCEFDTIYHEHLCYFSLHALNHLFARHALKVVDATRIAIHGGSLRVTVARRESAEVPAQSVAETLQQERDLGIDKRAFYDDFARRVAAIGVELKALLARFRGRSEHRQARSLDAGRPASD